MLGAVDVLEGAYADGSQPQGSDRTDGGEGPRHRREVRNFAEQSRASDRRRVANRHGIASDCVDHEIDVTRFDALDRLLEAELLKRRDVRDADRLEYLRPSGPSRRRSHSCESRRPFPV